MEKLVNLAEKSFWGRGTCTVHILMWEMVRREKVLRNCLAKEILLSPWGKKELERGDLSISGKNNARAGNLCSFWETGSRTG